METAGKGSGMLGRGPTPTPALGDRLQKKISGIFGNIFGLYAIKCQKGKYIWDLLQKNARKKNTFFWGGDKLIFFDKLVFVWQTWPIPVLKTKQPPPLPQNMSIYSPLNILPRIPPSQNIHLEITRLVFSICYKENNALSRLQLVLICLCFCSFSL